MHYVGFLHLSIKFVHQFISKFKCTDRIFRKNRLTHKSKSNQIYFNCITFDGFSNALAQCHDHESVCRYVYICAILIEVLFKSVECTALYKRGQTWNINYKLNLIFISFNKQVNMFSQATVVFWMMMFVAIFLLAGKRFSNRWYA